MPRVRRVLLVLAVLVACLPPAYAEEAEESAADGIEAPSPDGRFAFRYTGEPDGDDRTYELIDKASGKALLAVAESNNEIGPTARFDMEVLWRPDSKAFALTAMLWKRGSTVKVFVRNGSTFREIKVTDLPANIPEKVKRGKDYPHVSAVNSESAKRWQNDGSLVIEIVNIVDGHAGTITARRTVVLGFGKSKTAKVLKSRIKFVRDGEDE